MSDPERHGPAAEIAPQLRGKRFRKYGSESIWGGSWPTWRDGADLKKQLSEALERETATSQVLGIVSSSPSDLNPVFETILANASRLCEASYGALWLSAKEMPSAPSRYTARCASYVPHIRVNSLGRPPIHKMFGRERDQF